MFKIGPIESVAKRIANMGIANKTVGALGSLIFGALLLSGIDEVKEKLSTVSLEEKGVLLDTMADSVFVLYLVMALVLILLGVLIRKAPLPHVEAEERTDTVSGSSTKTSIFQFPHLWLGVLALFVYAGAEVIAGDTIIAYGISLGFTGEEAKLFTTYTLMAMVATYALDVFLIPKFISQRTALITSAFLGITNALVWLAIWPLTLEGLGKFTKTASALLITPISGGAIIPPLYGRMVDANKHGLITEGIQQTDSMAAASISSYWILIPCCTIILFFAIWGHKIGKKQKRTEKNKNKK